MTLKGSKVCWTRPTISHVMSYGGSDELMPTIIDFSGVDRSLGDIKEVVAEDPCRVVGLLQEG